MVTFALLSLGIFALLVGGTLLVRGASGLASNLGVSPLLVGLTVLDVMGRRQDPLLEVVEHIPLPGADAGVRRDVIFVVVGAVALMVGGLMTITYGAVLAESLRL